MSEAYKTFREAARPVEGWFTDEAAAIWDCLLTYQRSAGVSGNLLEIGVWKGKSALLSVIHAQPNDIQLLVDPLDLKEALSHIRRTRPNAKVDVFRGISRHLRKHSEYRNMLSSFRWIHIDGRHSAQDVDVDLRLADDLLSDDGIVVLDDFFTPNYPQVTQAVFHYMFLNPSSFRLLLCGFQKGYLTRPLANAGYVDYVKTSLYRDMCQRGIDRITIWKSTEAADSNAFGVTDRFLDFDYRGPDWMQKSVPV
ncbi:class I SAM-dependent methyltransferase [Aestuariivirga sp.]|uniref:class I SAM-dependent methyltransferase n=1 Tax=Aestuariivirga sp. TaxID=2650926 RepID=UPI00391D7348